METKSNNDIFSLWEREMSGAITLNGDDNKEDTMSFFLDYILQTDPRSKNLFVVHPIEIEKWKSLFASKGIKANIFTGPFKRWDGYFTFTLTTYRTSCKNLNEEFDRLILVKPVCFKTLGNKTLAGWCDITAKFHWIFGLDQKDLKNTFEFIVPKGRDIPEEMLCSVCLDAEISHKNTCGHSLCMNCWRKIPSTYCPICRSFFIISELKPLERSKNTMSQLVLFLLPSLISTGREQQKTEILKELTDFRNKTDELIAKIQLLDL